MIKKVCIGFVHSVLTRRIFEFAGRNNVLWRTCLLPGHLITLLHIKRIPSSVRNPLFLKSMTSVVGSVCPAKRQQRPTSTGLGQLLHSP